MTPDPFFPLKTHSSLPTLGHQAWPPAPDPAGPQLLAVTALEGAAWPARGGGAVPDPHEASTVPPPLPAQHTGANEPFPDRLSGDLTGLPTFLRSVIVLTLRHPLLP